MSGTERARPGGAALAHDHVASDLDDVVAWRLDNGQRQVAFTRRADLSVYWDTRSSCLSLLHAHPAWTLFLPVDGASITIGGDDGVGEHRRAVLVTPRHPYRVRTDGPHLAVYLNAWKADPAAVSQRRVLDARSTGRLLDALCVVDGIDSDAAGEEMGRLVGRAMPIDPRLTAAIDALPSAERLDKLARKVGLSPSRLRALAVCSIGIPLAELRLWLRLMRALAFLPDGPSAAAAATAGFADQPHLTRVARRFLGRTPGRLALQSLPRSA